MSKTARLCTLLVLSATCLLGVASAQTHDHAAMSAGDGQYNPYIISDNKGGFYAAFVERQGGKSNVRFQQVQGNSFSPAVRVNNVEGDGAVRNENPPKLALGPNGEVYVVWANERERWKGNIRFARSLNGGKSFEPAVTVNTGVNGPAVGRAFQSIVVDRQGRIVVAWIDERNKTAADRGAEIWLAISTDGGKTFSRDRRAVSNVCECCRTALAVDSLGKIYLSYRIVPATGAMNRDIAVARSEDGGLSFKTTLVSHDGWDVNACPIAGASMTIDAADRIHVVWFTQLKDAPRLLMASSNDHGISFSKPYVFDSDQKLAKHAHVVAANNGRVLVAWDDVNDGSKVKWALVDPVRHSLSPLGTQLKASYPIVAFSGDRFAVVALESDTSTIFRAIRPLQ
jgi:hypothetical protein